MELSVNFVVGVVILTLMAIAVVWVWARPQLSRLQVRGRAQRVVQTVRRGL